LFIPVYLVLLIIDSADAKQAWSKESAVSLLYITLEIIDFK
jgi:hypothetical protein